MQYDAAAEKNKFTSILISAVLSRRGGFLALPNWSVGFANGTLVTDTGMGRQPRMMQSLLEAYFFFIAEIVNRAVGVMDKYVEVLSVTSTMTREE